MTRAATVRERIKHPRCNPSHNVAMHTTSPTLLERLRQPADQEAWRRFYSFDNLKAILLRTPYPADRPVE